MAFMLLSILMLIAGTLAETSTYAIPTSVPTSAAVLDPAPVGISYEFFAFPSYHTNISATTQCEKNLKDLSGSWPSIRIGGTTQDRADYDPSLSAYVSYSVAASTDAPSILTFGPSFMTLAGQYAGRVVLGLNRGHNNILNTIAAAKVAKAKMPNLLAIELGNEPEYYASTGQPVARGTWNAATDAASQAKWQISVGNALRETSIIEACNSLLSPPTWGAAELIAAQNPTALSYVNDFSHHNYPGGTVQSLMSHSNVASNIATFRFDVAAALNIGKQYVFGETNSAADGGTSGVSPTFGVGLWVGDVSLRAASASISRLYFHHGTIGACHYCWWGRYNMGAPYYGAIFATAAMAGGARIVAIDSGSGAYAVYAIYSSAGKPIRVALYNSDYYAGRGTRGSQSFVLSGLKSTTVTAKRLTAASALSKADQGSNPTWGGQSYANGTCVTTGSATVETTTVSSGKATFILAASEALLVYL